MVEQNLPVCLGLSALAGMFTVIGKAVVVHMARKEKEYQQQLQDEQMLQQRRHLQDDVSSASSSDGKSTPPLPPAASSSSCFTRRQKYGLWLLFVVANPIIANACMVYAPWFGPVSLYWPTYIASQLLSNMLIIGTLLQHEHFDKHAQVATLMVVASVVYIALTGPQAQPDQDIRRLLQDNILAVLWLCLLGLIFVMSFASMMWILVISPGLERRRLERLTTAGTTDSSFEQEEVDVDVESYIVPDVTNTPPSNSSSISDQVPGADSTSTTSSPPKQVDSNDCDDCDDGDDDGVRVSPIVVEVFLLLVSSAISALSATTSKAASTLDVDDPLRSPMIVLTWALVACWTVENFLEGSHARSLARFLPYVTLGSIWLNAVTGLIVWQDYLSVKDWAGYATALVLLGMGVYLISDLDFFRAQAADQQDYHREFLQYPDHQHHQHHHQHRYDHDHVTVLVRDLISNLEEDLSQAQLQQSLPRHQLTMQRVLDDGGGGGGRPSLQRGHSDPELGTRSGSIHSTASTCFEDEYDSDSTRLFQSPTNSGGFGGGGCARGMVVPLSSAEDASSSSSSVYSFGARTPSLLSQATGLTSYSADAAISSGSNSHSHSHRWDTPIAMTPRRFGSSVSATARTLDSLERLAETLRQPPQGAISDNNNDNDNDNDNPTVPPPPQCFVPQHRDCMESMSAMTTYSSFPSTTITSLSMRPSKIITNNNNNNNTNHHHHRSSTLQASDGCGYSSVRLGVAPLVAGATAAPYSSGQELTGILQRASSVTHHRHKDVAATVATAPAVPAVATLSDDTTNVVAFVETDPKAVVTVDNNDIEMSSFPFVGLAIHKTSSASSSSASSSPTSHHPQGQDPAGRSPFDIVSIPSPPFFNKPPVIVVNTINKCNNKKKKHHRCNVLIDSSSCSLSDATGERIAHRSGNIVIANHPPLTVFDEGGQKDVRTSMVVVT